MESQCNRMLKYNMLKQVTLKTNLQTLNTTISYGSSYGFQINPLRHHKTPSFQRPTRSSHGTRNKMWERGGSFDVWTRRKETYKIIQLQKIILCNSVDTDGLLQNYKRTRMCTHWWDTVGEIMMNGKQIQRRLSRSISTSISIFVS
jgi:hypothetical protein